MRSYFGPGTQKVKKLVLLLPWYLVHSVSVTKWPENQTCLSSNQGPAWCWSTRLLTSRRVTLVLLWSRQSTNKLPHASTNKLPHAYQDQCLRWRYAGWDMNMWITIKELIGNTYIVRLVAYLQLAHSNSTLTLVGCSVSTKYYPSIACRTVIPLCIQLISLYVMQG